MADQTLPKVSATLSLEPTTHSFSSSQAPTLNITLLLDYHQPITIYADDLSPRLMLLCAAFNIHSRSSGEKIHLHHRTHCRIPPPTRVPVTLNESRFHTLLPSTPYTISGPFTRTREGGRPLAASDPEYRSDDGACGVDGLEAGHEYILTLGSRPRVHWQHIRWWEYGTKEDVLRGGLNARTVIFGRGPHERIPLDTSAFRPIEFRCDP